MKFLALVVVMLLMVPVIDWAWNRSSRWVYPED